MLNLFKPKEYIPNQHAGETKKMGIFEDEYTIAERKKRDLDSLKEKNEEDTFRDSAGNEMPISKLNGLSEQLLREARESIREEKDNIEELNEGNMVDNGTMTAEAAKTEIKAKKIKTGHQALDLLAAFSAAKEKLVFIDITPN